MEEGKISRSQSILEPVFYESELIGSKEILGRVEARAGGRPNWVFGAGGEKTARILSKMYSRGHSGPLWEYLVR